mgnify:CR=1 FL=1
MSLTSLTDPYDPLPNSCLLPIVIISNSSGFLLTLVVEQESIVSLQDLALSG